MKKWYLCLGIVLSLFIPICTKAAEEQTDAMKFKEEYESYNGLKNENGQIYQTLIIPENNPFWYVEFSDLKKILEDGTGILYFGYPSCPWCRTLIEVFLQAAESFDLPACTIGYVNFEQGRDELALDAEGNLIVLQEGSEEYQYLLEELSDWLGPYEGLHDDTLKRIYLPTMVFVLDGEIQSVQIGTVDSQKSGWDELSEEAYQELLELLCSQIHTIF